MNKHKHTPTDIVTHEQHSNCFFQLIKWTFKAINRTIDKCHELISTRRRMNFRNSRVDYH